jgi:hypothetical protein
MKIIFLLISISLITLSASSSSPEKEEVNEILKNIELPEMYQITENHNDQIINRINFVDHQISQIESEINQLVPECNRLKKWYLTRKMCNIMSKQWWNLFKECNYPDISPIDAKNLEERETELKGYYESIGLLLNRLGIIEILDANRNYLRKSTEYMRNANKDFDNYLKAKINKNE